MKIPVKETIISGDWLQCSTNTCDGEFCFRLRPTSFEKAVISDILPWGDDKCFKINLNDGDLWILKVQVINLNKAPFDPSHILDRVVLLDQDDFLFNPRQDRNLIENSNFAELMGLIRFIGQSTTPRLSPKVKSLGALAFDLPDDEHAEYYISLTEGSIKAV